MIKSTIDFSISHFPFEIEFGDELLFLGSCFSDSISDKAKYYGLNSSSNPFGTIFHPIPIARNIKNALENAPLDDFQIVQNDDLFFTFEGSAQLFGYSNTEIIEKYNLQLKILKEKLIKCDYLFLTFGTAWSYLIENDKYIVANCHKQSVNKFKKQLDTAELLFEVWLQTLELIKKHNPRLKIVFTVSPVRHIKDGVVENNWSKSQLIELTRRLAQVEDCFYFPSYEIMIDELRDYRYYKIDRVHPNEEAVNYIWRKFQFACFSVNTIELQEEVEKIRKSLEHKSLFDKSNAYLKFISSLNSKIAAFKKNYPKVNLD